MKFQLLKTYLLPHKWRLVQLSVLLFSGSGLQLFAPQLMRRFLDGAQTGAAMRVLLQTAVFFFIVTVIQKFVTIATTYVSQDLGWTATNQLRADLAQHVLRLDMGFHKMRTSGELIERIDGDVEKGSLMAGQSVGMITKEQPVAEILAELVEQDGSSQ